MYLLLFERIIFNYEYIIMSGIKSKVKYYVGNRMDKVSYLS